MHVFQDCARFQTLGPSSFARHASVLTLQSQPSSLHNRVYLLFSLRLHLVFANGVDFSPGVSVSRLFQWSPYSKTNSILRSKKRRKSCPSTHIHFLVSFRRHDESRRLIFRSFSIVASLLHIPSISSIPIFGARANVLVSWCILKQERRLTELPAKLEIYFLST